MSSRHSNQRGKYFVDRSVQGALLLRTAANWGLFLLLTGLFILCVEVITGHSPREAITNLRLTHGPTILAVAVLAPLFLYDMCKLSNRFAGPMVRLRQAMRELADGQEVSPCRFRAGDYWGEMAQDFNRIAARVQALNEANQEEELSTEVPQYEAG